MKTLLALLCTPALALAQSNDHAAWRHVQSIHVPGSGLIRVPLPSDAINAAKPGLDDLRIVNSEGVDVPYVIEQPTLPSMQTRSASLFKASLAGASTVIDIDTGTAEQLHEIMLTSPSSDFIKAARLEGSNDGTQWQPLASNEVLFRQQGVERLRVRFEAQSWKKLRLTVDDARSAPAAFTGASLGLYQAATPTLTETAAITKRDEIKGATVLTLRLPTGKSWLGMLRLKTPEPIFSRSVLAIAPGMDRATGSFVRIALEGSTAEVLELPLQRRLMGDELTLRIENGDSPPLKIEAVEVTRYPQALLCYASAASDWQLFTGNNAASSPSYDVAALRTQLQSARSVEAQVGALQGNPAYRQEANAPDATGAGATLDLAAWSKRKSITFSRAGVVQVELDQETLAAASSDWRDLRVMQGGRQVPFLLEQTNELKSIEVPFALKPDPKRPTTTRWAIALPFAKLPIHQLTATSATPLFERSMTLSMPSESSGQARETFVFSTAWRHKPGNMGPLSMDVRFRAEHDQLILSTDNGDNAPIVIDAVQVACPVVRVLFKAESRDATHLYFANPTARTPQYDLGLIRHELSVANKETGTLGAAETVKPEPLKNEASSAGGPWLWAALVLVMGGLLWMVAKLLPKPESAGG